MLKVLSKFHIIICPEILTKNSKLFFKPLCITLRSVVKVSPKLFQFVFTCSNSTMHNVNQNNTQNLFKVTNKDTKTTLMTLMLSLMMMMMIMNCFCDIFDRRQAFTLISSRGHCHRSSSLRISHTPQAGFEPAQNLSSGLI